MIYLLFQGENYYPGGGSEDLVGVYSDLTVAKAAYRKRVCRSYEWKELLEIHPMTLKHKEVKVEDGD